MDASLYCPALVYPSLCHQQLPSSIFFFFHFTVLSRSYQMSLSSQEIPLEKSQGPYKQSQAWNTSSASITLSLWDIGLSKAVCSIMTTRGVQITPEMDQKDLTVVSIFPTLGMTIPKFTLALCSIQMEMLQMLHHRNSTSSRNTPTVSVLVRFSFTW